VAAWLETEFHELAPKFTNKTGKHLARYSREDLIAICGEVDGRALYNELHPNGILSHIQNKSSSSPPLIFL
jgi:hypothetical protein